MTKNKTTFEKKRFIVLAKNNHGFILVNLLTTLKNISNPYRGTDRPLFLFCFMRKRTIIRIRKLFSLLWSKIF